MMMVGVCLFINLLPTLLYFQLYAGIVVYVLGLFVLVACVILKRGRHGMIASSVCCLFYTIFWVIPGILQRMNSQHPLIILPLGTLLLLLVGIAVLYIWGDEDRLVESKRQGPCLATHDVIHYLSVLIIFELGYYNSYLLSTIQHT